jgi:inner membrane protein
MDSITHLFYGGVIAAAIAPKQHRRAALLAGMALNTLPDLDIFPLMLSDDPVVRMTWHRSATHSWLVLPFVAWAIWWLCKHRGGRVAQSPVRWWWAIFACLMAHPLLDGFTVYGTQLLWPLPMRPIMWSSLFIIDPLFTLPWFLAFAVAWFAREKPLAQRALVAGIVLGVGYVGWSLFAKSMVERDADRALASIGLADAPRFSVPAAMNTWQWRIVAMTGDGHVEAFRSLSDTGPMRFVPHRSDVDALRAVRDLPGVRRLAWFNHGFMAAETRGDELILSDLRMGAAPHYAFGFVVADRAGASGWRGVPPIDADRRQTVQAIKMLWRRLWNRSPAAG